MSGARSGGYSEGCPCKPCESPAYGAPGYAHCAACCYGTMIEAYDHSCPIAEHQRLAEAQWGPLDNAGTPQAATS